MSILPDMIGLTVDDIPRSLAFYRLLDLDIADPEPGRPYCEVITPNGYRISWNAVSMEKQMDPDWVPAIGHRMGLAFLCSSPADVDAVHARVVKAGHPSFKEPWDAFWGQRYAIVVDPDGNRVSLFAPLSK